VCVTCESVCGSWDFGRKEYDYMIFFFFFFYEWLYDFLSVCVGG
jgi:hypothetical protein